MSNLPAAILLDLDGTLVDTEPIWAQSEIHQMASLGVPWTIEQAAQLVGTTAEVTMATLEAQMRQFGVDPDQLDKKQFYGKMVVYVIKSIKAGLKWMPGARELLLDIAETGMACALVSSSPPDLVDAAFAHFPRRAVSVVVNGKMVSRGKPHPEAYLLAAEKLGVNPADCLVVEDTTPGALAGLAAGAVVVTVPGLMPMEDRPGQVKLPGLDGVDVASLRQIFAEVRGVQ